MALRQPERLVLSALGTARGNRVDARILHLTGHSPYSYLYGKDMGRTRQAYRPPITVTTIGHRSGRRHTVALAHFATDDGWAVVGSAHGSDREPHWVRNLRHNPAAWVRAERRTVPVVATVLDGDDKLPMWNKITARAPLFDAFQASVERDIPVVVLQPRTPRSAAHRR